ncbi:MAG: esterase family protein [Chitinophagales bacterium]|nr:esterase family protein [Chitinophagales bacterium]
MITLKQVLTFPGRILILAQKKLIVQTAGEKVQSLYQVEHISDIYSPILNRATVVDVFIPPSYSFGTNNYPFLVLNDGQDSESVRLKSTLSRLIRQEQFFEPLVFSIHAGNRIQEYGVAAQSDFKKRGSLAKAYSSFLMEEFLPLAASRFRIDIFGSNNAIAGYSLGGLSALDIGWNYPEVFKKIGVFSGSLWWRSKGYNEGYTDEMDRIIHSQVRADAFRPGLKFWFQTGTQDERADRNANEIIDSIDDTLDLIAELVKKGYRPYRDIEYLEIKGGHHNQKTWAKAMPYFLKWAFFF